MSVVLAYLPVWQAGFVWDDDAHLTANPCIVGPLGLREIWMTSQAQYYPLVLTTFWLEHKLWGLAPVPYHVVNVVLHAVCAMVLWRGLLLLRVEGAWLGSALWALHPVAAESVAWVTEMKNTQSCLFYLLAIFFYIKSIVARSREGSTSARYAYPLALFFAALALSSKSSTVVLPVVLGLVTWWIEARWPWRRALRIAPFFLLSAAAALMALRTVDLQGVNQDKEWLRSWPERFITGGRVFWFYLEKLAWPHPLVFIYPRWSLHAGEVMAYFPLVAAIGLFVALAQIREAWSRACLFALAYFVAALLPVLGLVEHYFLRYSFVADHLQYLASIGPLALAGVALARLPRLAPAHTVLPIVAIAGLLSLLTALTWQRSCAFENQESLWTDTLSKNPASWLAHNNLGGDLLEKGEIGAAISHYEQALAIKPNLFDTEYNLGNAYMEQGDTGAAIDHYERALAIQPADAFAHFNLGVALFQEGRIDDAIVHYRSGLLINPNVATAHYNLGNALAQKGEADKAMDAYSRAVQLDPGYFKAHYELANLLLEDRRLGDAINQYEAALQIDPTSAKAHNNLGVALVLAGQVELGEGEFKEALRLQPGFADAQRNVALARAQIGRGAPQKPAAGK